MKCRKKTFLHAKDVCTIYSENYKETVQNVSIFFYKNNNNGSKTGRTQNPNKMYAKSAQNVCKCP